MNKIMLIGNLGKEPDMSYTPSGLAVTRFSLAVNRRMKSQSGEPKDETEWFNITAFGNLAETCSQYLHKGNKVFVEGRLQSREYTGNDGIKRRAYDVIIGEMEMLTPKDRQSGSGADYQSEEDPLGELEQHPF